jgi:cytochrome oxidase Cu insertion factor (SCO1/SenC/PrrC family)
MRRTLFALLLAVAALAIAGAAVNLDQLMQDFRVIQTGRTPAPAFALSVIGGQPVTLAEQRGRPVLLYFWATW